MIQLDDVKPALQRLFKTKDGEILMEFLTTRFYDNKIKEDDLVRQVGQRDVVWTLKQLLEEDDGRTRNKPTR